MCNFLSPKRSPLLHLEEVIDVLRESGKEGLTFQALSLNLYNRHADFFGEISTLRTLRSSLRKLLKANVKYFSLSEEGCYKLFHSIPQQLFINFDAYEEACDTSIFDSPETQTLLDEGLQQLELDFTLYDPPPEEPSSHISIAAEDSITYEGSDQQLLLNFFD